MAPSIIQAAIRKNGVGGNNCDCAEMLVLPHYHAEEPLMVCEFERNPHQ